MEKIMKRYDFMKDERFNELTTADEYIDYFITVKQDLLISIDAVNWSIMNCKLRLEERKADIILETDFKELYGKDNEGIRKAHITKENKELIEQLEVYKNNKSHYENQLKVVNEIIEANYVMLTRNTCECDCNDS